MTTTPGTRQYRIQWAVSYVARNPETSKRQLQKAIKETYGTGLRDAVIRQVLREANTPNTLKYRINTHAFIAREKKELREFLQRGNPPYLAAAINHRYTAYKDIGDEMRKRGFTFKEFLKEFRRIVRSEAKDYGWLITDPTDEGKKKGRRKGMVDIFKMLKDYRDKSIDQGDYKPMPKRKSKSHKGNIRLQKQKYKAKQTNRMESRRQEKERARLRSWIAAVDVKIIQAKGEKRRKLQIEREELQTKLAGLR